MTKKSFRTPDQLSYMCERIWAQDHIFVSLCKHKNGEVPLHHAYCRCPALTVTVTCSCQQITLTVSVGSNYACGQWSVCELSPVACDGTSIPKILLVIEKESLDKPVSFNMLYFVYSVITCMIIMIITCKKIIVSCNPSVIGEQNINVHVPLTSTC